MGYQNYRAEDLRKDIIEATFDDPVLGENYIDWHDVEGQCGLTLIIDGKYFDLTIVKRIDDEFIK